MPSLSQREKELLGPAISPFERSNKPDDRKVIKDGEDHSDEFTEYVHDAIDNGKPKHGYIELTLNELEELKRDGIYREKCFLWVIDEMSIKMIRENTRNTLRTPPIVCHTNLTGAGKAFVGGELFFCEDGNIYISPKSDRYGRPTQEQWQTALSYFRRVGYSNVIDILGWLSQ